MNITEIKITAFALHYNATCDHTSGVAITAPARRRMFTKKLLVLLILVITSCQAKSSVWITLLDSTSEGTIDTIHHLYNDTIRHKGGIRDLDTKYPLYLYYLTKIPYTSPRYQYKMKGKFYFPNDRWHNGLQFELTSNNPKVEKDLSDRGGGQDFILIITRKSKWYKKAEKMIIRMDLIEASYKLDIVFKPGIYFMAQLTNLGNENNYKHPYNLTPKNWDKYKINKEQLYKVSRKYVTNPFEKQ